MLRENKMTSKKGGGEVFPKTRSNLCFYYRYPYISLTNKIRSNVLTKGWAGHKKTEVRRPALEEGKKKM